MSLKLLQSFNTPQEILLYVIEEFQTAVDLIPYLELEE
jgi:hypothetical protein